MQVVAIDGYPDCFRKQRAAIGKRDQHSFAARSASEFVVTTPKVGDQAQLITQYWNTGPDGDFDPTRPIANIVSQNGS